MRGHRYTLGPPTFVIREPRMGALIFGFIGRWSDTLGFSWKGQRQPARKWDSLFSTCRGLDAFWHVSRSVNGRATGESKASPPSGGCHKNFHSNNFSVSVSSTLDARMSPSPGQSKHRYVVTAYNSRSLTLRLSLTALAVLIKVFLSFVFFIAVQFCRRHSKRRWPWTAKYVPVGGGRS
jgi:hypothetical protein